MHLLSFICLQLRTTHTSLRIWLLPCFSLLISILTLSRSYDLCLLVRDQVKKPLHKSRRYMNRLCAKGDRSPLIKVNFSSCRQLSCLHDKFCQITLQLTWTIATIVVNSLDGHMRYAIARDEITIATPLWVIIFKNMTHTTFAWHWKTVNLPQSSTSNHPATKKTYQWRLVCLITLSLRKREKQLKVQLYEYLRFIDSFKMMNSSLEKIYWNFTPWPLRNNEGNIFYFIWC